MIINKNVFDGCETCRHVDVRTSLTTISIQEVWVQEPLLSGHLYQTDTEQFPKGVYLIQVSLYQRKHTLN